MHTAKAKGLRQHLFHTAQRSTAQRSAGMQGFAKNLKFLKNGFDPSYDILDMRKISDTDFEARWSMGFEVLPIKKSPLGKFWQPKLNFTGTTIYCTNAETGKI